MDIRQRIIETLEFVYSEGFFTGQGDGMISVKNTRGKYVDEILSLIRQEVSEAIPKEKEIRYEELDTGIGIDKIEYDGQEFYKGFNQALSDIRTALKEKGLLGTV